jgi:hypothetical protein
MRTPRRAGGDKDIRAEHIEHLAEGLDFIAKTKGP